MTEYDLSSFQPICERLTDIGGGWTGDSLDRYRTVCKVDRRRLLVLPVSQ